MKNCTSIDIFQPGGGGSPVGPAGFPFSGWGKLYHLHYPPPFPPMKNYIFIGGRGGVIKSCIIEKDFIPSTYIVSEQRGDSLTLLNIER